VLQLAGLRGLMVKPNGEITRTPILSNFREGLSVLEYFSSTHGARKGLCDTALKTANCGYMTRRLVEVAHNVVVSQEDCGTPQGLWVSAACRNQEEIARLTQRLVGCVASEAVLDPIDPGNVLLSANEEISEAAVQTLLNAKVQKVKIRSVLTCQSRRGVCVLCYGRDLATRTKVRLGTPVGIVAAQSIGEPGMQLTMRTFHTGGAASESGDITGGLPRLDELFEARRPKYREAVVSKMNGVVEFGRKVRGKRCIVVRNPQAKLKEGYLIPNNKHILVSDGECVSKGQRLTEGSIDPHLILDLFGAQELQERLVREIREIYHLQGVIIHEKHVAIIVRQMLRNVRITEPGETKFFFKETVNKFQYEEENSRVMNMGRKPAQAKPVLLGITKASFQTESFLSAASFQFTTQVLTQAAAFCKRDDLLSLKANIIAFLLIPAGTGFDFYGQNRVEASARTEDESTPAVTTARMP
jgi:DNA-directed RNA polymerase subunit beta'